MKTEWSAILKEKFGIAKFTPVQEQCIPAFSQTQDVVVQSPTGTGKTLAYLLPLIDILLATKPKWKTWEIGGLVITPNRELARQVIKVLIPLIEDRGLSAAVFVGGSKTSQDIEAFKKLGGNIVVGTPGRLEDLINQKIDEEFAFKTHLKHLKVLVLDEADRLLEMGFQKSLDDILSHLPKQRRTGLFSATQVKDLDELVKTSLRNPIRIEVSPSEAASVASAHDDESLAPVQLENYYIEVEAEAKLATLVKVLKKLSGKKILLFVSSCACVEFLEKAIKALTGSKGKQIICLHGKKRKRRPALLQSFLKMGHGLMICTDVMARGIDIPDVDWVLQFDPPRKASWFIHRSGRSARSGRQGSALIFLAPSEMGYLNLLESSMSLKMKEYSDVTAAVPENSIESREVLRTLAQKDRDFLENGTKAYVSYIQAYSKHDCHIVCSVRELDVVGTAHAFGLLRLPKMPELRNRDLSGFSRVTANTSEIPYLDKAREKKRQILLTERREDAKDKKWKKETREKQSQPQKKRKKQARMQDLNDIDDDYKLIKKLKKGKISKNDFDSAFQ